MSTTTLGIIGTGMVGAGAARRAVDAGLHVVLGNSRGPGTLDELVARLGPWARAATPAEVARAAEVVLAAVPLKARELLPREDLVGRIVIDPMNYAPSSAWNLPELDGNALTSSELVQRDLPGARVVKALHNIGPKQLLELFRPAGAPDRTALPVSGDDTGAKKEVAALLDVLGFDTVDLGPLAESWRSEPNTPCTPSPTWARPRPASLFPSWWPGCSRPPAHPCPPPVSRNSPPRRYADPRASGWISPASGPGPRRTGPGPSGPSLSLARAPEVLGHPAGRVQAYRLGADELPQPVLEPGEFGRADAPLPLRAQLLEDLLALPHHLEAEGVTRRRLRRASRGSASRVT